MSEGKQQTFPERLWSRIKDARYQLVRLRETRKKLIEQYSACFRNLELEDRISAQSIIPTMLNTGATYFRLLMPNNPEVIVTVRDISLLEESKTLQYALNSLLKQLQVDEEIRMAAFDALFGPGVLRAGIDYAGTIEISHDVKFDKGKPFVTRVAPDDFVCDITARRTRTVQFIGERVFVPLEFVRQSGLYKFSEKLKPVHAQQAVISEGQEDIKADEIRGSSTTEHLVPLVELWEIYLPLHNIIITLPGESTGMEAVALRVQEYQGPEGGPFHLLQYNMVPDKIFGIPPAAAWYMLHRLTNIAASKIAEEVKAYKRLGIVPRGAEADAEKLRDANHCEFVSLSAQEPPQDYPFCEPSRGVLATTDYLRQLFNWAAGNPDMLAGLQANSPTATQDIMLRNAATDVLWRMREAVRIAAKWAASHVAWYVMNDPTVEIPVIREEEGNRIIIQTAWSAIAKQGTIEDYDIEVDPVSLQTNTAEAKLARLQEFLATILQPLMPLLVESGHTIDIYRVVELFSQLGGLPEAKQIVRELEDDEMERIMQARAMAGRRSPSDVRAPANTTRREVRSYQTNQGPVDIQSILRMAAQANPGAG